VLGVQDHLAVLERDRLVLVEVRLVRTDGREPLVFGVRVDRPRVGYL
jgi:hypothetical protein